MKWHFPPTCGGSLSGLNDSSQEHFQANAWEHTIRETIQNSLDAADEQKSEPVTVEISEITIPASEIGSKDLAEHMKQASECTDKKNKKGVNFYKNALKVLRQDEIPVLAITDTNTTGLVDKKWDGLVHEEGTTSKDRDASGGSFGIGKNAPYLVSSIKTVCYSTRYLQRKGKHGKKPGRIEQSIARCKISSHRDPKYPHEYLQNIGFGTKTEIKKNQRAPTTDGKNIYKKFRLDNVGSGIFIIGFEPKTKDWVKIAKESITRNFFVAIHEKKLEVIINSESINYETLDNIFENGKKKENSRHYYHIIRDSDIKKSIEGNIGKFIIKLCIGDEDLPNRIAYVNRRGMLITDERTFKKNPFSTSAGKGWAKYAGVVIAQDDKTDEKIRELEPPNHSTIELERVNDQEKRELIKKELKEIQKKITDFVNEHIDSNDEENDIQLSELAGILAIPGNDKENDSGQKNGSEDLTHREIDPPNPSGPIKNTNKGEGGEGPLGGLREGEKKKLGGGSNHPGNQDKSKSDITFLNKKRIVRNENKLYVAFTPQRDDGEPIRFAIIHAGEEKRNESVIPIIDVNVVSPSNSDAKKVENNIVVTSKQNGRIVLDLEIPETEAYTGYEIVEIIPVSKPMGQKK